MSPAELARLYDAYAAALFAHLHTLLGNDTDVRDVLQEVFRKLAARAELLAGVTDERAYLLRLAHHAGIDHCRRRDTRQRAHDRWENETTVVQDSASLFPSATDPDEAEFRAQLATALAGLPVEQRTVVQLKLWEGLTFEQIATVLDVPPNTAASRYRYAVDKLRAHLRPLYDEIR